VVEAALAGGPMSGYEMSNAVFGDDLSPQQRRFAVAEALSHLERLVREGRAARSGDARNVTYTAP
jgi:metallo-beta-lactamase-like protein